MYENLRSQLVLLIGKIDYHALNIFYYVLFINIHLSRQEYIQKVQACESVDIFKSEILALENFLEITTTNGLYLFWNKINIQTGWQHQEN